MNKRYVVKLTLDDALKLGIVHCVHCGWPPNNHFDSGKRLCAHDGTCPGYKRGFSRGKTI